MIQSNFLICLVGLPSSGKSTFANHLKMALNEKYSNLKVKIIDPDRIRNELTGDKFDPHKEYLVKNKNLKAIRN
ncbi:MAG: adenylyl-sulfate kinase, partial [Candidatus Thorarchaeota archaeon]